MEHRIGILGTGAFLPPTVRTNAEVGARTGISPEWILERTGVRRRHIAGPGQATSDLAAEAVREALECAGIAAEQLDLLVLATSTPDELGPSTACRVQASLGARNAVAFDVSAACSGWLFATRVARDWLLGDPGARYAAVVGCEVYSPFVDAADRPTAVLFADGAAATVMGPVPVGEGFGAIALGSDGRRAGDVLIPAGGSRRPASDATLADGGHHIVMDGHAVRDFIVDIVPRAVATALEQADLTLGEVDVVVMHQPNPVLLRGVGESLGIDPDRLVVIGDRVGNIGAGSLPFGLAHAAAEGRIKTGDRVLLVGFGAGLTWGSTVLTWSGTTKPARSPLLAATYGP
ncbi:3-oxoacyl-ACP synthase III family protein [Streptomyces olivoreticuli]|uniref:3-oxoacyl-ACP synthase III family protein n=1 Tax=Streptomyces olivoreticuli TaxID=68246 RepID=UPI000E23EBA1|nr:ketoacyl-ACP synthase III [Streptomyces olivoreticuli]